MNHIIYEGTPSLPHTFEYTPDCDAEMMLYFVGTAYTNAVGSKIGLELVIENNVVASTSVYCNSSRDHQAMHPGLVMYRFPLNIDESSHNIKPVSITIRAISGTVFDSNDYVTVACI